MGLLLHIQNSSSSTLQPSPATAAAQQHMLREPSSKAAPSASLAAVPLQEQRQEQCVAAGVRLHDHLPCRTTADTLQRQCHTVSDLPTAQYNHLDVLLTFTWLPFQGARVLTTPAVPLQGNCLVHA